MAHAVRYLILACALVLFAPFAAAQPGSAQPSVRFTVFAPQPVAGVALVPAKGAPQPLEFRPAGRSPRYTHTGASPIRFVDTTSGATVAEATVPPEIREPLLLFIEAPPPAARGLRYQIMVVDDSATQLPPGHFALLNLSGLKLTGQFGTAPLTVDTGLNAPVPFAKVATRLTLFTTVRGQRVQSFADTLKPLKTGRLLLILFPPARKGAAEIQARALADEPPRPLSPTAPLPPSGKK